MHTCGVEREGGRRREKIEKGHTLMV